MNQGLKDPGPESWKQKNTGNITSPEIPPMTLQTRISLSIETFPTLCIPQQNTNEVKIYTFKDKSKLLAKRSPKSTFRSPSQKRGFINSSLTLSKSSLISASDLLHIRPLSYNRSSKSSSFRSLANTNKRSATNMSDKQKNNKRHILESKRDTGITKEVYKVSYPCSRGCANCAFTRCLGPVRVYVSQFKRHPTDGGAQQIAEVNGGVMVPKSRRKEVRGMVYDKDMNSFYPPLPRRYRQTLGNDSNFYKYKLFY